MSVFQVDQLLRSALRFAESLRMVFSTLACPSRGLLERGRSVEPMTGDQTSINDLPEGFRLLDHVDKFLSNVRYLTSAGGDVAMSQAQITLDQPERELREVSNRLQTWLLNLRRQSDLRLTAHAYSTFDHVIGQVLSTIGAFSRSLVEDMNSLFRTPNYVAMEMLPVNLDMTLKKGSLVNTGIFAETSNGLAFNPDFMTMLKYGPGVLQQPAFSKEHEECNLLTSVPRPPGVPVDFLDIPGTWVHRDVSGVARRLPSPLQLLHASARHAQLSNLFISFQLSSQFLSQPLECGSTLTMYDPTLCLLDQHWGGYFFHLNPLPPYNMSVIYAGKPLGPGAQSMLTDVHSIDVPSMDTQWSSVISTFKSLNHHSPDSLFLSPFVGNCVMVDRLLSTGTVKPKLLYLPINPLKAPPAEETPNFFDWWSSHGDEFLSQLISGVPSDDSGIHVIPVITSIWNAHCTLSSVHRIAYKHGYTLLHVEHTFATFMWEPLYKSMLKDTSTTATREHNFFYQGLASRSSLETRGGGGGRESVRESAGLSVSLYRAWLTGWQCSPHSRYLFDLEVFMDHKMQEHDLGNHAPSQLIHQNLMNSDADDKMVSMRSKGRSHAATIMYEVPTQRYFIERHSSGSEHQRGQCREGICECFPPFRGSLCEQEDPASVPQSLKAVIHYMTAETEQDMQDIEHSLTTLWTRFNKKHDYPVVVFHEGLSGPARTRIAFASENRVWMVLVPRFKKVPLEWEDEASRTAQDFSVGYRAMIRWRSGPLFLESALSRFDYAMTLDTDSYFPADVRADPFRMVHDSGLIAAFPHLGRESASVVVNFMHYFLLFCNLLGLHPRRTRMLQSLIESNFKWYQQCMMLDIEILRLDWFRDERYQNMFRYMDSTGGFWLHRWGNNPFRTFAVALLLEDSHVRSMELPYAHQDYCSCGPGAPLCVKDPHSGILACNQTASSLALPPINLGDLAEGLLDLQPWRGTERQKKGFAAGDVHKFVQETSLP